MNFNYNKLRPFILMGISAVIIVFVTVIFIKFNRNRKSEIDTFGDYANIENQQAPFLFGISTKGYAIIEDKICKNQLLSDILAEYNVPLSVICEIENVAKSTYSLSKLKVNNNYTLFVDDSDTIPTAHYLEYDIDKVNYVVYAFNDSVYSYLGARPVDTVYKKASGKIETSLWDAMTDNGISPSVCNKLSDIYAWTVDFFGIKKGDFFNVLYEEVIVDGEKVGTGKVLAAELNNEGKNYFAYYYDNNDNEGYFNENGESLKRQFLQAPLKYQRISSEFSYHRLHPIYKIVRPHLGVDYAAPIGTPIHSVGNGVVIAKGWDSNGGGNFIKIKHNNVYTTLYMHLRNFAPGISNGSKVQQGQLIGYVGSTGAATGPHLDFRVYKNGNPINPLKLQPEPIQPLNKDEMQAFKKEVNSYNNQLFTNDNNKNRLLIND